MTITADRVLESTTSTGTGDLTLIGAAIGFQSFDDAFSTGQPCWYAIDSDGGAEWEIGVGQLTTATNFVRTTVLASSNGGSAVNLTAGTKRVFATLPGSAMSAAGLALLTAANAGAQRTALGLGSAAVEAASAFDAAGAAAAAQAASQPLDSDLTAIAALSTTSFGRAFLALADAAALRTTAGLVIGSDVQAYSAVLASTTASFTTADETKLDGIAAGATANDTDANLRARSSHTGTQAVSTISDFRAEAHAVAASF